MTTIGRVVGSVGFHGPPDARGRVEIGYDVGSRGAASLALVRSLGFRHIGEQIDEVDGLELVFESPLPLGRAMSFRARAD